MNPLLLNLTRMANKPVRNIIGLMSGTSLDGLDIALCAISGSGWSTSVECREFTTIEYTPDQNKRLKGITSVEHASMADICYIHTWLGRLHASFISDALREWGIPAASVDLIASHGQSIYHLPARDLSGELDRLNSTLQIGDADQIALLTGIPVVSDFRQKHVAAGGEGAPMAGFVDQFLFSHESESRILLNIGGIGNFTWLPARSRAGKEIFITDTGPGNTLIDKLCQLHFQLPFDKNAELASKGEIIETLLDQLLSDPWFIEGGEKTTGPEYFSTEWYDNRVKRSGLDILSLKPESQLRTATELTSRTIAKAISDFIPDGEKPVIYASGGGARNPLMMRRISELLPHLSVQSTESLGVDPDAKEAVLFAVLANEMIAGEGFRMKNHDRPIHFGKISLP